jgi:hypothetical protein
LKRVIPALAVIVLAACTGKPEAMRSDWEVQNAGQLAKEAAADVPALPRYPVTAELVAFTVDGLSGFRLGIDPASLTVSDGIVRYALVARSTSGADNTTYEALNCRTAEYRLYASGRADGRWIEQHAPWRDVGRRPIQRSLMRDYFCPGRRTIYSVQEGISALREGGHPQADAQDPTSAR